MPIIPNFYSKLLPLSLAIGLTACGGTFNNPSTITAGHSQALPQNPQPPQPVSPPQTPPTQTNPLIAPTLGSALPIVKRNLAYNFEKGEYLETATSIDDTALTQLDETSLAQFEKTLANRYKSKVHKSDEKQKDNYQFVKAGWIFAGLYPADTETVKDNTGKLTHESVKGAGYLFYQGDKPTTGRTHGKVSYTGHWDFMSDVKRVRDKDASGHGRGGGTSYGMDDRFGDEVSATSFATQTFGQYAPRVGHHLARFEVDFDNKSLTGKLTSKIQRTRTQPASESERYNISATITGNRFVGSATATNSNSEYNLFAKNATNRLEGGFFGENAEELAGKFLTDDNSLFGVFAGKNNNATPLETRYDGVLLEVSQDKDINPTQKAHRLELANFGNVNQLYINGKLIDLLPQTANTVSKQVADLPTGQKAVITSFGTADGALRLGSISKTAKAPYVPSDDEIKVAKQQLAKLAESQADKVDTLLTELSELEDDQRLAKKPAIVQAVLAGYSDSAKVAVQARLEKWLDDLIQDPEDYDSFEKIVGIVAKGDKYDQKIDKNWQAFLPNATLNNGLPSVDNFQNGLYILGERTRLDAMPTKGEMTYTGTWHGRIGHYYQSEAGYGEFDGKAEFGVDFGKKRLSGTLTETSGVAPAFVINATIAGNGFSGTATSRASGINLDKGQQQNQQILPQTTGTVTGNFYGENAKHLAGSFGFENKLENSNTAVVGGAVFYGTTGE